MIKYQIANQLIIQKIYTKYGKDNVQELHIRRNPCDDNYPCTYFVTWLVIKDNNKFEYKQSFNI